MWRGLQASGLSAGAQQVPCTLPCGPLKLQSLPDFRVLHAARASGGGGRRESPPGADCAYNMPPLKANDTDKTACARMDLFCMVDFHSGNRDGGLPSIVQNKYGANMEQMQ